MKIGVHSLTHNPTAAWQELSLEQKVIKINAKVPTSDAPNDKVDLRYIKILSSSSASFFFSFNS